MINSMSKFARYERRHHMNDHQGMIIPGTGHSCSENYAFPDMPQNFARHEPGIIGGRMYDLIHYSEKLYKFIHQN